MNLWKTTVKVICLFIPRKKWRKSIREKLLSRSRAFASLEDVFVEIKEKREQLLSNAQHIDTLFLGSSHVAYGFNPQYFSANSFNLASNSQDLFTSYSLLKEYINKLPDLKQVFIGYSVFSCGWNLALTSAAHICSSYKFLYGFEYETENYIEDYEKK